MKTLKNMPLHCPICGQNARPAQEMSNAKKERLGCSNEYYHHFVSEGEHYVKKRRGPQRNFDNI